MSPDETMQLWTALGTWFAAVGTISATVVALWLARRAERVKLKASVGIRWVIDTPPDKPREILECQVTNLGERPVTVTETGWFFGKKESWPYAIQLLGPSSPDKYPKRLEHGETAWFWIDFAESPNWKEDFVTDMQGDTSLECLRAYIATSVGRSHYFVPEETLLKELRATMDQAGG